MAWSPTSSDGHELPAGFLRSCLLLLLVERGSHAYALCERLGEFGLERLDQGTVYRALHDLEDDGLAVSHLEGSERGPPRRVYEPTAEGVRMLRRCARSVVTVQELLATYRTRCDRALGTSGVGRSVIRLDERVEETAGERRASEGG